MLPRPAARDAIHGYWELARPFTLLPPLVGMLAGACAALGAGVAPPDDLRVAFLVGVGSLVAVLLNAASNVLNQIHDVELDRVNKPGRPLPAGRVSPGAASRYASVLYAGAIVLALLVRPADRPELALIVLLTAGLTWIYSAPPVRARNSWWLGPLVIAIPRGGLLKVAGWAVVAPVMGHGEPWILGGIFFLFVLGCAPIKDFPDMAGDRAGGASSLPLRFGPRRAAWIMAPFFVIPWLALALLPRVFVGGEPLLSVDPASALVVGLGLALHGAFLAGRLVRSAPSGPGVGAWRHLYLLMMEAQIGLALLYLVAPG